MVALVAEDLLVLGDRLVPVVFAFLLLLGCLLGIDQFNHLAVGNSLGWLEFYQWEHFKAHKRNDERMFAIKATILVRNQWICH